MASDISIHDLGVEVRELTNMLRERTDATDYYERGGMLGSVLGVCCEPLTHADGSPYPNGYVVRKSFEVRTVSGQSTPFSAGRHVRLYPACHAVSVFDPSNGNLISLSTDYVESVRILTKLDSCWDN